MATVSIIVTTYNVEQYIEECLASVAAQTLHDIEVLVVDDGSTDSTPSLIREFAARDSRFVPVLLEQNSPGGVATAANAGLDRATGDWIGFVDGDDFVEPDMFESLVNAASLGNADLAMCKYLEVDETSGQRNEPADAHRWATLEDPVYPLDVVNRQMFLRFIAVPWRKLYRRDLLEDNKIRFPEGDYFFEDNPFHWFAILSAKAIAIVPKALAYHRVARAGQTMATADERLFRIFMHHDTIHRWLVERELLGIYQVPLLTWVISQLEWISRRTPQELRGQLYAAVRPIFAQYDVGTVIRALNEGNKGEKTRRLSLALAKGDQSGFSKGLEGRPDTNNLLLVGWHHLRYSGVRRTAQITGRYAKQQVDKSDALGRVTRVRGRHTVSNADLMFALATLQQQLDEMQERLAQLEQSPEGSFSRSAAPESADPR
ncbi:glycosyltransferase family 2 protein [Flexivirga meconopsidis]|uniref:glycosyltransferase family 2 protein n=1 Tax=Flexivirga meconopsidis TaxID=2977121 RepID=UPI002240689A|nr:glycosyltransferase family 2 protein [Flexivirga meconopsidis]